MSDGWLVSTLKAEGIDPEPLLRVTGQIRDQEFANINGFVIVRNGKLAFEE